MLTLPQVSLWTRRNVYVTGTTGSTDFPTAAPLQSALRGRRDAFVLKINPAGSPHGCSSRRCFAHRAYRWKREQPARLGRIGELEGV